MPVNPVPIVNALGLAAVIVVDPPRLTELPLIVIELFVRELLPILVNVLVDPLIDLLVKVSVVARPTNVSVDVGSVNVPVFTIVAMVGLVSVNPATTVSVPPKEIEVDPRVIELFVNALLGMFVNVFVDPLIDLLVSVSVVALPTNVSVDVGKVNVPVFVIVEITGAVNVLLVRV